MNKVYAWYPSGSLQGINVGHASLDISFGAAFGVADYVSWWPTQSVDPFTGVLKQPRALNTFPQDREAEGHLPDAAVEIYCLDEARMRDRWNAIKRQGNYSLYFRNCAFTVVDVLVTGGADLSYDVRRYIDARGLWTPREVIQLARLVNTYARTIERQRSLGWKFETQTRSFLEMEASGH